MLDHLINAAFQITDKVIDLRRQLHQIPEPSFAEAKTSALVASVLEQLDLRLCTGIRGTGVIADLGNERHGYGTVVLRADMDALPIVEHTKVVYRSRNHGYAHACGHDGHTATLLGTAMALAGLRRQIPGRVRFLFQPAEEIAQGAKAMIEAGALGPQPPDAVITLHAWPGMAETTVASIPGVVTASNDAFTIHFHGQGGHSARPALSRSPLLGMARLIEAVDGMCRPDRVVTICVAKAGEKDNIIPDTGQIAGTLRALNRPSRDLAYEELLATMNEVARRSHLEAKLLLQASCPEVRNDPDLYNLFMHTGERLSDYLTAETLSAPSMGAEDFGHYVTQAPSFLFRVGMGVESWQLHTSSFDYQDRALRTGVLMLGGMALAIAGGRRGSWKQPTEA